MSYPPCGQLVTLLKPAPYVETVDSSGMRVVVFFYLYTQIQMKTFEPALYLATGRTVSGKSMINLPMRRLLESAT
jgi:hypothetical protein